MNSLRFLGAIFLAAMLMLPQAPLAVEARAPATGVVAAFVPQGGTWKGTTKLGWPVSFTVNPIGTAWSNFHLRTKVTIGGCTAIVDVGLTGPGPISSNLFSRSTATFRFTGQFTTAKTATGTYAFTNQPVAGCSNKTFSQSGTWSAKAPVPPPGAFSKLSPANLSSNQPVSITLSWNASTGATAYDYCVDTVSNSLCDTTWKGNGTKRTALVSGLSQNTTYYWQVRARNTGGATGANSSTWWSFTTGTLPSAFGKTSPSNGATSQALASTLSWGASTGAASYQFCFDTVNNNVCDTGWKSAGTSTTVDPAGVFLPGTTYYWQVRAVNSVGAVNADSATWWSFSTIPPSVMTLTSLGAQDGWILETSETSGIGGKANATATTLYVGDDASNRQYRTILSFGTGPLPDNAVIMSATLKFKKAGSSASNPFNTLGSVLVDVRKGPFGGNTALQLSDFQATASQTAIMSFSTNIPVGSWYTKAFNAANINKLGPTQFRLRFAKDDNNNHVADYLYFFSGNVTNAANRPTLVIQYYVP